MKNLAHERFIEEMIQHGNRVQAYQAAYPGTSAASATTSACRLLKLPHIMIGIEEYRARMEEAARVYDDRALAETRKYLTMQNELYRIIEESVEEITDNSGKTEVQIKNMPALVEAALLSSQIRAGFLRKYPSLAAI